MKFKTPCPICAEPITLRSVMFALHPWAMKCLHCKSKVKARNTTALAVFAFTILVMVAIFMIFLATEYYITLGLFMIAYLLFGLLFEFILSLWIINRGLVTNDSNIP